MLLGEDHGDVGAEFGGTKAGPGGSLVSAKEERDLAALLDLFALGVGDVEEFQDRLQAELAALEACHPPFPGLPRYKYDISIIYALIRCVLNIKVIFGDGLLQSSFEDNFAVNMSSLT